MEKSMKIQKFMSQSGMCSRRKAEEFILREEVYVNGSLAHIGQIIDSKNDRVQLGKGASLEQQDLVYYKYNKPRGIETTCAQKGGKSIIDVLDIPERVFPVGRLDKETTGLILLTNDGRITNFLTHPRYGHEKEYIVEVFGPINDAELRIMSEGVIILGKITKQCKIDRIAAGKFSIILTEGKNRQIRRMVEYVGHKVKKLKRIRIENIEIGKLPSGAYRHLSTMEKTQLFEAIGLDFNEQDSLYQK